MLKMPLFTLPCLQKKAVLAKYVEGIDTEQMEKMELLLGQSEGIRFICQKAQHVYQFLQGIIHYRLSDR